MRNNLISFYGWKLVKYFTRYIGIGLFNTIIGFVIIFSFMAFGFSPLVSNMSGYAVGFALGFVFSKKFVFRSNGQYVEESIRYLAAFGISFLFNLLVLRLALDHLHFSAIVSQIAAAISYSLLMYILVVIFVFGTTETNKKHLQGIDSKQ